MKKRTLKADPSQFLSGWKEIANFLGMGVRTIQRYERELGLPVRRPAGKVRGSVVAVKAELDGWVKASPIREVFRLRNAPSEYPSPGQSFMDRLSELVALRDQMITLRSELKESVSQLQTSVRVLVNEQQNRYFSPLYTEAERDLLYTEAEQDLLDWTSVKLKTVPVKYPKAS